MLLPVIVPGCVGSVFIVTFKLLAALEPHELIAVTETFPPLAPGVTVIDLVVELPVHPDGNVQLYVVAPVTAEIL